MPLELLEGVSCKRLFQGHTGVITCLGFQAGFVYSGCADGTVRKWDASNGKCVKVFEGHTHRITGVELAHGVVYTASFDATLRAWNDSNSELRLHHTGKTPETSLEGVMLDAECVQLFIGHSKAVTCCVLQEYSGYLVSGSKDKTIRFWDVDTGDSLKALVGHRDSITTLLCVEERLFSASFDSTVRVWQDYSCVQVFEGHSSAVHCIAFDDDVLYSGADDGSVRLFSVQTSRCFRTYTEHKDAVTCIAVSDDIIYSGSRDGALQGCLVQSLQPLLLAYNSDNGLVAMAAKGSLVYVAGIDQKIHAYHVGDLSFPFVEDDALEAVGTGDEELDKLMSSADVTMAQLHGAGATRDVGGGSALYLFPLEGHTGAVHCLFESGGVIYSGSDDMTIRAWIMKTGDCALTCSADSQVVCFGKLGSHLYSGGDDGSFCAWDIDTGRKVEELSFDAHDGRVYCIAVDGQMVYSGGEDGCIKAWKGELVGQHNSEDRLANEIQAHDEPVTCLVVLDGRLYSSSMDATVKSWNLRTDECVMTYTAHTDAVTCIVAMVENKAIYSGSNDTTVRGFSASTGADLGVGTGHAAPVSDIVVDGPVVFTTSLDGTVRLWTTALVCTFVYQPKIASPILALETLSKMLVTAGNNGTIKVWKQPAEAADASQMSAGAVRGSLDFFDRLDDAFVKRGDELLSTKAATASPDKAAPSLSTALNSTISDQQAARMAKVGQLEVASLLAIGEDEAARAKASRLAGDTSHDASGRECSPAATCSLVPEPHTASAKSRTPQMPPKTALVCTGGGVSAMAMVRGLLYCGTTSGEIQACSMEAGGNSKVVFFLQGHSGSVVGIAELGGSDNGAGATSATVAASSSGDICSASADRTIRVWDVVNRTCTAVIQGLEGIPSCFVVYSERVFVVCGGSEVESKELADHGQGPYLRRHTDRVTCITLEGDALYTGGRDKLVVVWGASSARVRAVLPAFPASVARLAVDAAELFVATTDGVISQVELVNNQVLKAFHLPGAGDIAVCCLTARRRMLYFNASATTMSCIDVSAGKPVAKYDSSQHKGGDLTACILDNDTLYTCGNDGTVAAWPAMTPGAQTSRDRDQPSTGSGSTSLRDASGVGGGGGQVGRDTGPMNLSMLSTSLSPVVPSTATPPPPRPMHHSDLVSRAQPQQQTQRIAKNVSFAAPSHTAPASGSEVGGRGGEGTEAWVEKELQRRMEVKRTTLGLPRRQGVEATAAIMKDDRVHELELMASGSERASLRPAVSDDRRRDLMVKQTKQTWKTIDDPVARARQYLTQSGFDPTDHVPRPDVVEAVLATAKVIPALHKNAKDGDGIEPHGAKGMDAAGPSITDAGTVGIADLVSTTSIIGTPVAVETTIQQQRAPARLPPHVRVRGKTPMDSDSDEEREREEAESRALAEAVAAAAPPPAPPPPPSPGPKMKHRDRIAMKQAELAAKRKAAMQCMMHGDAHDEDHDHDHGELAHGDDEHGHGHGHGYGTHAQNTDTAIVVAGQSMTIAEKMASIRRSRELSSRSASPAHSNPSTAASSPRTSAPTSGFGHAGGESDRTLSLKERLAASRKANSQAGAAAADGGTGDTGSVLPVRRSSGRASPLRSNDAAATASSGQLSLKERLAAAKAANAAAVPGSTRSLTTPPRSPRLPKGPMEASPRLSGKLSSLSDRLAAVRDANTAAGQGEANVDAAPSTATPVPSASGAASLREKMAARKAAAAQGVTASGPSDSSDKAASQAPATNGSAGTSNQSVGLPLGRARRATLGAAPATSSLPLSSKIRSRDHAIAEAIRTHAQKAAPVPSVAPVQPVPSTPPSPTNNTPPQQLTAVDDATPQTPPTIAPIARLSLRDKLAAQKAATAAAASTTAGAAAGVAEVADRELAKSSTPAAVASNGNGSSLQERMAARRAAAGTGSTNAPVPASTTTTGSTLRDRLNARKKQQSGQAGQS